MKSHKWKHCKLRGNQAFRVEDLSGVYVVKKMLRVMELPLTEKIVYVGKSKNLKRRFREHCNIKSEHNLGLLKANLNEELEFWYLRAGKSEISKIESYLIDELKPLTNIRR